MSKLDIVLCTIASLMLNTIIVFVAWNLSMDTLFNAFINPFQAFMLLILGNILADGVPRATFKQEFEEIE